MNPTKGVKTSEFTVAGLGAALTTLLGSLEGVDPVTIATLGAVACTYILSRAWVKARCTPPSS